MKELDNKYAKLLIETGVNVQKGQTLIINADPQHHEFVALLTEEAYKKGAKEVIVKFTSEVITRLNYIYQEVETLTAIPNWLIEEHDDYITRDLCKLALRAPYPGLMQDVDSTKVMATMQSRGTALKRYQDYSMNSLGQWLVAAYPSYEWSKAVFPELDREEGFSKLYDQILYAVRVDCSNLPSEAWDAHNKVLAHQNSVLNESAFSSIHFSNSLGTDIEIGLVQNHVWSGGKKNALNGVSFNANIPTEESFTTPDRNRVNGIVYNSLPLNNNGRLIDQFWLKFKDGKVIDFDAKIGKSALEGLLDTDEHSRYIGEIALISNDSPISNLGTLFYNTLFDENASCHIALGKGYPLIPNGGTLTSIELLEKGINQSLIHVDFMFGTKDLSAVGIKVDGTKVQIIENGNIIL